MIKLAKLRFYTAGSTSYRTDAEDAVQNAFLKITKYIHAINTDMPYNSLKAYMLTVVSNEVNTMLSRSRAFEDIDDREAEICEAEFLKQLRISERYNDTLEAINKLDEIYGITLICRYGYEMEIKDIASFMGVSDKTVYTRLSRGKRMLLDMLKDENHK